ncbi:MAG: hypothetical protein ACTHOI_06720 [Sphingomicrobium sp.]
MKLNPSKALMIGTAAFVAAAAFASVAQAQPKSQVQQTPKGWSYDIQDGKRVPKGNRVNNPDGSWREELRQGSCITVKERSATGEYKETRQCNPVNPG